ncbi:hypothetical protein AB7334_17955 [Providencia rettgeri]
MNNEMLELAKELKANALLTRRYQISKCSVWSDQLIKLCEHVEKTFQANEDSTKLIEAFCADDAEWHKLLDVREQENLTLIRLVVKLADKYSELQKELDRINTLSPIGYIDSLSTQDLKCGVTALLFVRKTEPDQIPLYRLDK